MEFFFSPGELYQHRCLERMHWICKSCQQCLPQGSTSCRPEVRLLAMGVLQLFCRQICSHKMSCVCARAHAMVFPHSYCDTKGLLGHLVDGRQSRKIPSLLCDLPNSKYFKKGARNRNLFQTHILNQKPTLAPNRCWNPPILVKMRWHFHHSQEPGWKILSLWVLHHFQPKGLKK